MYNLENLRPAFVLLIFISMLAINCVIPNTFALISVNAFVLVVRCGMDRALFLIFNRLEQKEG